MLISGLSERSEKGDRGSFGHYEPSLSLNTIANNRLVDSFTRLIHVPLINPLPLAICAAKRDQPGRAGSFALAAPQKGSSSAASLLDLVPRLLPSVLPLYLVCGDALHLSTDQQTVLPVCESDMQMCGAMFRSFTRPPLSTDNG